MTWKKVMSLVLALCMTLGLIAPAIPTARAAESSNIKPGYMDPWQSTVLPELAAPEDANVDEVKFTHDEWTGKTVGSVKNENVYAVNREKAGSFSTSQVIYDSVEHAVAGARDFRKEQSAYVQYLTGESQTDWSLVVVKNATVAGEDVYRDFYKTDFTPGTSDWKANLRLPASWTYFDFDYPIYTNTQVPWQEDSTNSNTCPLAPVIYNPVGLYRKAFQVNEGLKSANGRIYLNFQGVEAAYYVYVNGKEVGYSEDTYSPHSFDVTDYLVDGQNLLAVEVHKFCDGTWFELQDMYKDGGIFRDVYLYSAPLVHIDDYRVITDLDENYENAALKLDVRVRNSSNTPASGYKVDVRLYDQDGEMFVNGFTMNVGEIAAAAAKDGNAAIMDHSAAFATAEKLVLAPKLWSAETPNLYTLVLSLYSADGVYMGSMSQQLGFREIGFKSSQLDGNGNTTTKDAEYRPITINGKPLLLKGTNRHDSDPVYGKYVPHAVMEKDVELMKQYNLNAIRTSHYSNDDYLYYLCDKYGLYMMAETNLESHQIMNNGDKQKLFKNLAMDRTVNTFQRLKNSTAVVCWSTGNENYYSGSANYADGMFSALICYFKDNDPTRPIHSEGSNKSNGTDMGSNMYPTVGTTQSRAAENMPYVICEYVHSMGNATGNLKEYWDVIRSSDNMLGAFVWDWVDQGRRRSLDKLGAGYAMTEAKGAQGTVLVKGGVNDAPGTGAITGKSIVDGYVVFDDADGAFNSALSGNSKSFTIEVICKPASLSGSQILFAKGDKQVAMKTNGNGEFEFFFYNGDWQTISAKVPTNWLNNWHQVVGVYDKGKMTVYIDGVQLITGTKSANISSSSEKLALGYQTDKKDSFKGEISMGRIYTKALTATEIDAQRSATPAISSTSHDVLLWADFTNMIPAAGNYYNYYAEPFAHESGIYDNAGYFYTLGGDSGETNHSGNFAQNGMVSPDRDVQPELHEVKYQYQSFWFTADDLQLLAGQVEVYNENSFLDLSDFELVWTLKEDGKVLGSGIVENAAAAPREVRTVKGQTHATVPLSIPYLEYLPASTTPGAEYYLNLSVRLKGDTLWAEEGYEVAHEQFRLPADVAKVVHIPSSEGVNVNEGDEGYLAVTGPEFSFKLSKATGAIEEYEYKDALLLEKGPTPNYWRAPVNNDNGNFTWGWQALTRNVRPADENGIVVGQNEEGLTTITVKLYFPNQPNMVQTIVYTIENSGAITLTTELDAQALRNGENYKRFLRIGTTMVLPEGFEDVSWYGNGPVESMWDRKSFAIVDKYENTVNSLYYPYLNGGDTGTMTDTKWVTITNPSASAAMAIAAKTPIEFSALHFTADDLTAAKHPYELSPRKETYLSVNLGSQGTGNASCGPDTLSQYCIWNDKAYSYSYTMVPYETEETDVTDLTRPYRGVTSSTNVVVDEAVAQLKADIGAVVVTKAAQLAYLNTLQAKYELLPAAAKAELGDELQKLQDDIARARALETNPYAKVVVEDKSKNHFDVNLTDQANASLKLDGEMGGALSGYFIVDTGERTKYFNNVMSGSKSFTIEAVIRPNYYSTVGTDYSMIMSNGDHGAAFRVSGGIPYFYIYNGTEWKPLDKGLTDSFTEETVKQWHHVAAIYDGAVGGGTISVYMNGEIIGSLAGVGQVKPSDFDLGIGYCPETGRTSRNDISTIRLYGEALSVDELGGSDEEKLARDSVELWYDFSEAEFINSIGGEVSILGNAKFDSTLTADLSGLVPEAARGHVSYAWTREGDVEPVGEESSYTLTAADIGKTITLTVSGSDEYIGTLTAVIGTVEKATQEAPTGLASTRETAEGKNDGTIIGVAEGMEYSADDAETWMPVTGDAIEDLAPGKYLVRYAETDTHVASNSVEMTVLPYVAPEKMPTPEAEFDAATMLLTNVAEGMRYKVNNGDWTDVAETEIDLSDTGLASGSTIQIYQPGDGVNASDSEVQVINLTQAAVPTTVGKTDETRARDDGAITGVTDAMEYKKSGADAWTPISGTTATGLTPGEYLVRVAGTGTVLASSSVTVIIAEYVPTPVTGVVLDRETLSLTIGGGTTTAKLAASTVPVHADNQNISWSSSDDKVATVNQNGTVTAVAEGSATITVTTEEGGFTAECTVTVTTYVAPSYTPPTTKTVTRKNEDGSTTKIVTDLRTGAVTETTTWPDGTKIVTTTDKNGASVSEVTVPKGKDRVMVTIPRPKKPGPGEVAVIIRPGGTREIVKTSVATGDGIRVTLTEGATLEVMDNSRAFVDVAEQDWFGDAVQFIASRALMDGTGAETFSPDVPTSRAMLMTVLARLDGQDTSKGETWYSIGMEWAKEAGVSDGTNPGASITREQLAAMLYRYAGTEKTGGDLGEFSDADSVSDWAAEAMAWAMEKGIVTGRNGGLLAPGEIATRAEVAAMLERFVKLEEK